MKAQVERMRKLAFEYQKAAEDMAYKGSRMGDYWAEIGNLMGGEFGMKCVIQFQQSSVDEFYFCCR